MCYVFVACIQMLGMDNLNDVLTAEEFGFNVDSWMKSDATRKREIYAFVKHLLTSS